MQSFHSKSMPAHLNIPRKSKKASEIVISSKIAIAKRFKGLGSRTNFSMEQFNSRIEMRKLESLDTIGISVSMMMNKGGIKRSFKPQARNVPMLAPDQQEDLLTAEEQKNLWAGYTSAVRKMIANAKVYPPTARDKGQQGKIDLSFKLGKHGELLKLLIENSSGNNILDDAARNAVKNAGPFPPIPEKLNKQYVLLELPISFVLR
jgi:TonB family protein